MPVAAQSPTDLFLADSDDRNEVDGAVGGAGPATTTVLIGDLETVRLQ